MTDVVATEQSDTDDSPPYRLLSRELSWLDFNDRVLTLATEPGIPLLERAAHPGAVQRIDDLQTPGAESGAKLVDSRGVRAGGDLQTA